MVELGRVERIWEKRVTIGPWYSAPMPVATAHSHLERELPTAGAAVQSANGFTLRWIRLALAHTAFDSLRLPYLVKNIAADSIDSIRILLMLLQCVQLSNSVVVVTLRGVSNGEIHFRTDIDIRIQ